MHLSHDATDQAELLSIRAAARMHGPDALKGSAVYASGHPCPMRMAAMRLAGVSTFADAYSNEDGAPFNLSTADIAIELRRPFAEQYVTVSHIRAESGPDQNLYEHWANDTQPSGLGGCNRTAHRPQAACCLPPLHWWGSIAAFHYRSDRAA